VRFFQTHHSTFSYQSVQVIRPPQDKGPDAPSPAPSSVDGGVDNPSEDKTRLYVEIVTDLPATAADASGCAQQGVLRPQEPTSRDAWSIQGICKARGNRVRCSAGALSTLLEIHKERERPSATLLYIVAHEVAHIALGHTGRFTDPLSDDIPSSGSKRARLKDLENRCDRVSEQLNEELAADAEAIKLLQQALVRPPYVDPLVAARSSVLFDAQRIETSISALLAWEGRWVDLRGPGIPAAIETPQLPASDAYVTWSRDRLMCDAMSAPPGSMRVPLFATTHPDPLRRASLVAEALQAVAQKLPNAVPLAQPPAPAPLSRLLGDVADAQASLAVEEAAFREKLAEQFCAHVRERVQKGPPACRAVPRTPPAPPQDCLRFQGQLFKLDGAVAVGELLTSAEGKGTLRVHGTVSTLLPLTTGDLLLGLAQPVGYALWKKDGTVSFGGLPCAPSAAAELPRRFVLQCEAPLRWLVLQEGVLQTHAVLARVSTEDGPQSPDELRAPWLGVVDGRLNTAVLLPNGRGINLWVDPAAAKLTPSGAWQREGCEQLKTGFAISAPGGAKVLHGVPAHKGASLSVITFTPRLERVQQKLSPEEFDIPEDADIETWEAPAMPLACGPHHGRGDIVCADLKGEIFSPAPKGKRHALGLFSISSSFVPAPSSQVRLCGTGSALYILTVGQGEKSLEAELHMLSKGTSRAVSLMKRLPVLNAGLHCTPTSAAAFFREENGTLLWRSSP
jgi:hypothetical protein